MLAATESDGASLATNLKRAAFSQWPMHGAMGYNIFTTMMDGSPVRYTEWAE